MILSVLKMYMAVHKLTAKLFLLFVLFAYAKVSLGHDEFVSVIAQSKAAVVIIETTRSKKKTKMITDALGDNADFFQDDLNDLQDLPRNSHGSGFIVNHEVFSSESTFILTAGHVVFGASRVKVLFSNDERKTAKVVWLNKRSDVALLEVNVRANELPRGLSLTSDEVLEGQSVLSIAGSFFGLSVSSSLGIVSAVDVRLPGKKKLRLIQTDAAINPGASGGPLLDSQSRVVGVISSIYTKTGTFSGAAFAVPATHVLNLINKKHKK